MNEQRELDKQSIAKRIANSTDGMMFIKYLIEDYMVGFRPDFDNQLKTYYNLGVQKWVKDLLKLVEDSERFERILIHSKFNTKK